MPVAMVPYVGGAPWPVEISTANAGAGGGVCARDVPGQSHVNESNRRRILAAMVGCHSNRVLGGYGVGFFEGGDHGDDGVDFGELEEFEDAGGGSGGDEADSLVLAAGVMLDDHARAGRVHVGDGGEVEDVEDRELAGGEHRLQVEEAVDCVGRLGREG